mmetsp:Transcript_1234/g.3378  ORF Transcript_1234/g.3378 Transcript_1234/m.3378 type:complete len:299 (+) Transcript_1234:366-1262(+)
MQSHISIFGSTRIVPSIRIDGQGVDGTKVSLDTSKFFLIDQMKEPSFKLSHLTCRRRDTHGFLSSSQQNMILVFRNDSIIDGTIRLVGLEMFQMNRIVQFGGKVGTGGNKECLVAIELYAINLLFMQGNLFDHLSRFGMVQPGCAIIKRDKQMFIQCRPSNVGGIDPFAPTGTFFGDINFLDRFIIPMMISISIFLNIKDGNLGIVLDEWVRNGSKAPVVFGPMYATDGSSVRKGLETFSGLTTPHFDSSIRTCRQQMSSESIHIQIPNGSLVSVKGSQTFPIFRSPYGRSLILAGRE